MVLKMTRKTTRAMPQSEDESKKAESSCASIEEEKNQRTEHTEHTEHSEAEKPMSEVSIDKAPSRSVHESESVSETGGHTGLTEISLFVEDDVAMEADDVATIDELMEAAKAGDLPLFDLLCQHLQRRHILPDCAGYMGWTAAHWAARQGHLHILEYLRSHDGNLDLVDRKGDSLLHKAAANGQYRTCQWLLLRGFNVQAKNNNGLTPLDIAQQHFAMTKSSDAALCEHILAQESAHTF